MQRNTATTFGQLQPGDRFYFSSDSKRKVYQLTEPGQYNIVNSKGLNGWQYSRKSSSATSVVYLRNAQNKTV